jgi:hypothetical protein
MMLREIFFQHVREKCLPTMRCHPSKKGGEELLTEHVIIIVVFATPVRLSYWPELLRREGKAYYIGK